MPGRKNPVTLGELGLWLCSFVDFDPRTECWLWTACINDKGYAIRGRLRIHRVTYELFVGPISKGLEPDHLCRVRRCINPKHLEPVTRRENIMRGDQPAVQRQRYADMTHCKNGHPWDAENTRHGMRGPYRIRKCRACARAQAMKAYYREKEAHA